jgi:peptidoglycan hydrolase-like protein with peptidoglycan-binding domain
VVFAWAATAIAACLAGILGARLTLQTPSQPPSTTPPVYTVVNGSVGRTITLNASARWESHAGQPNGASGVVTSVLVGPNSPIDVGDPLYTVNLRPVIAARGAVASFRDQSKGVRGADVEQLQALLKALGFSVPQDGDFDARTTSAVKSWQRSNGVNPNGVVSTGDVLYFPVLPARVSVTETLRVGARVSGGEDVLNILGAAPTFQIELGSDQLGLVPVEAAVTVHHAGGTWLGRAQPATETGETVVLPIRGVTDGPVCGSECEEVPIEGGTTLRAEVTVVPITRGPTVPASALRTQPDGVVIVILANGDAREVHVIQAAEGLAVLEGVQVGERIRLFAAPAESP